VVALKICAFDLNSGLLAESVVKQSEKMLQNAMNEMDNPALAAVTCSSDYFKCLCGPADKYLEQMGPILDKFRADQEGIDDLANIITQSAHSLSWLLLHGKALSQTATDIEIGDSKCCNPNKFSLQYICKFLVDSRGCNLDAGFKIWS